MGKYQFTDTRKKSGYLGNKEIHPIWRGIGFIFMILIPFLAFYATLLLIQLNQVHQWIIITSDMLSPVVDPYLYIKIMGTLVISILIYIVLMALTFILYSLFGPPRYGPTDAPPPERKIRRRW